MMATTTPEQIQAAKEKFITDALACDAQTRLVLITKLGHYTRLGGERLMMPGKVQVPATVVQEVIDAITATL